MALNQEKGFTLLELIVVMLLVALILALSAAFFANSLPSSKFNATVREVVATIRHARALAQSNGETQTVTLDLEGRTFGIQGRGQKALPPGISMKALDEAAGEITTGKQQLVFPAMGGAEGNTIVLSGKKKTATITLDPILGSVATKTLNAAY